MRAHSMLIGGAGANPAVATSLTAKQLPDDVVDAASVVAAQATAQPRGPGQPN